MKANVTKIAEFLKADVGIDLIDNIVKNCHIEKMRKGKHQGNHPLKDLLVDGKPLMYRKGKKSLNIPSYLSAVYVSSKSNLLDFIV